MKHLIPLIFSILLFATLFGAYSVMYGRIDANIERSSGALAQTQSLSSKDALVRSQQILLEGTKEERAQLNTYVASENDVVSMIELIERTADSEDVRLSISTVNERAIDDWAYHEGIEIRFSVVGTFREITSLTATLEALPVAVHVQNVSLEAAGGGEWFGTFSVMFVKMK